MNVGQQWPSMAVSLISSQGVFLPVLSGSDYFIPCMVILKGHVMLIVNVVQTSIHCLLVYFGVMVFGQTDNYTQSLFPLQVF